LNKVFIRRKFYGFLKKNSLNCSAKIKKNCHNKSPLAKTASYRFFFTLSMSLKPLLFTASLVVYKPDPSLLEKTLHALQAAADKAAACYRLECRLTIVDNSCDAIWHQKMIDFLEMQMPKMPSWFIQLLKSPGNVGYGSGNNMVIAEIKSHYHLVVNPDLFIAPDAIVEALRFMESHREVGLLTPQVVGENGEQHYLCKRNPTLLIMFLRGFAPYWLQKLFKRQLDQFEMRDCDYARPISGIEFPSGCCMFFRTEVLKKLGGFDPAFFMYMEDADLGRRLLKISQTVYVPSVKVVHKWARGTHNNWALRWATVRSVWLYWKKWGAFFEVL
jgi:hypothetical protein